MLAPTQTASFRIHIHNLAFNLNKLTLVRLLQWACSLVQEPHLQVIRTRSGSSMGLCSAIFAVDTAEQMQACIAALNSLAYEHLAPVLGSGKYSLDAKEAYIAGAHRIQRPLSAPDFVPEPVLSLRL